MLSTIPQLRTKALDFARYPIFIVASEYVDFFTFSNVRLVPEYAPHSRAMKSFA